MEVVVNISPDAEVTIKAIDLVGDAWHDYLHYITEARRAEASKDLQSVNRALRAALGCLISHLDGVVTGLCEESQQSLDGFLICLDSGKHSSLGSNVNYLGKYAKSRIGKRLPYLNLRLKPLRDILVHPSIVKWDRVSNTQLSQKDIFDLTVDELDREGKRISRWLDALCLTYSYTRLHDTEQTCADLSVSLGQVSEVRRF